MGVIEGTGVEVGADVEAGVCVGGINVAVGLGTSVAFAPQADNANPAEVAPATFRKSLRESLCLLISRPHCFRSRWKRTKSSYSLAVFPSILRSFDLVMG
jgi:hypothetical protein